MILRRITVAKDGKIHLRPCFGNFLNVYIRLFRYLSLDTSHIQSSECYAVLPGGLVKKSRISHCGCIDPMVGATSLYDVMLHWKVT